MNLDGYNKSAKAQEIVQGLKVQPKSNGLSSTSSSEAESSKGIGVVGIVVIVVVAAVIVGAVIFVIKKRDRSSIDFDLTERWAFGSSLLFL